MNDSKNSSNGLLILKLSTSATNETLALLTEQITPTAEALGVEPMVLPFGVDVELQMGSSALLERVCVALEALVKQGEPPEVSEAQIAPQALNARVAHPADRSGQIGGLNTREVLCKGAPELGTACGECSRCKAFGWQKSRG